MALLFFVFEVPLLPTFHIRTCLCKCVFGVRSTSSGLCGAFLRPCLFSVLRVLYGIVRENPPFRVISHSFHTVLQMHDPWAQCAQCTGEG